MKRIAIAGYGIEGKSSLRYWRQLGHDVTIVDERDKLSDVPDGISVQLGPNVFSKLDGFDLVVRTAGLNPSIISTDGKIWSATNEFFAKCPAPIIGVTGTKGKGTVSSLIESILRADGRTVHLVGNIGIPALDTLSKITADDIVVFELSSFQLWDIERSPNTSVVVLVEPDHLNVHPSMEDYVQAKGGITRHQTSEDICVYHPHNFDSKRISEMGRAETKVRYAVPDDGGVFVENGFFKTKNKTICSVDSLKLRGEHNKDNACAALTVALVHQVSNQAMETGLRSFEGLPHRIEFVRNIDGVEYFNDSFSAAPSATVAAIRSFESPEIVVIGGLDKGGDFTDLAKVLYESSNIKEVILIGDIRHKLHEIFKQNTTAAKITVHEGRKMAEIVQYAHSRAVAGDVVLLSPGCASFDMFRDFNDRGDQFKQEVNNL